MSASYYMLLTATGQAKVAAHMAGGPAIQLAEMALGDGNGAAIVPTEGRAELYREVYRQALSQVTTDVANPNWVTAETVLPTDVGGWTIREVGLYDVAGDLVAYGNFPASYKPVLAEGSAKELIIRTIFEVASTAAITLTVDASVVFATQAWVNAKDYASKLWVSAQGFATQAWVNAKGYATQAWVTSQNYASTASNLGAGAGQLFVSKVGADMQFRSLKAGANIAITQAGNEITIAATGVGEVNTASNLGAGEGVYATKSGADLRLKSIKAGANVTVTSSANEITINAQHGVDDHGLLAGLGDDDHPQYLNNARGDARYAPITLRTPTTSAGQVRIPCGDGVDWMIQQGNESVAASGTYFASKTITFPSPFKPGTVPHVNITPIGASTTYGSLVAQLAAAPTATGFQALFDLAEGDGQTGIMGSGFAFQWQASGAVDDSGWQTGAAVTYTSAAGSPATGTINVSAGTYRKGGITKSYAASSAAVTGTGGTTVPYYLYYVDAAFAGGSKTLQTTTDPDVPFASADNVVVGQVSVAFPSSGSGGGGGDTGGGGGGGWCVSVDAWVIGRAGLVRAGDVSVGDELLLCDHLTGVESWGTVTHSAAHTADGVRVEASACTLTCSTTAPLPTPAGYVQAADAAGRTVYTRAGTTLAQDTVGNVASIGTITVQHITVGDRCFWASDDGHVFMLHHNMKAY